MSSRSTNNAVIKVIDAKLKAHSSLTPAQIRNYLSELEKIAKDGNTDARTKFNALKTLIEHDWDVYEHEHPAIQKIEHSGTLSVAQQIIEARKKRGL